MSDFVEEKASNERLGDYLKRVRETKGISLDELSLKTHISLEHLAEIEAGEWNKFPVEAYVRGYLNSIAVTLGLDMPKILEYYSKEVGSSYSQEFLAPSAVSSVTESFAGGKLGSNKSSLKTVLIVVLVLALAFFAGVKFLNKTSMDSKIQNPTPAPVQTTAAVEDDTTSFDATVPDGAENVPPESVNVAVDSSAMKAALDSAKKDSAKGSSATIFITSSASQEKPQTEIVPDASGKVRVTIVGKDSVTSWVGIYRSLNDNKVLREGNIVTRHSKISYAYNDTLCVVVGNPDAVSKLYVNDKETVLPVRKGYASRFCIAPNGKFTRR